MNDVSLYALIQLADVTIQHFDHTDDKLTILFYEVPAN